LTEIIKEPTGLECLMGQSALQMRICRFFIWFFAAGMENAVYIAGRLGEQ
jgi:hypothetical protein